MTGSAGRAEVKGGLVGAPQLMGSDGGGGCVGASVTVKDLSHGLLKGR